MANRRRTTTTGQLELPNTILDSKVRDMLNQIFFGESWKDERMQEVARWTVEIFGTRDGLLQLLQGHVSQLQLDRLVRIYNLDGQAELTYAKLAEELGIHRNTVMRARDLCFSWMRAEATERWRQRQ